jgi:hypothetical protein
VAAAGRELRDGAGGRGGLVDEVLVPRAGRCREPGAEIPVVARVRLRGGLQELPQKRFGPVFRVHDFANQHARAHARLLQRS